MSDVPRTAVIFRTHFWDAFAQRQFDRLLRVAGGTDVFVLVDETNGAVSGITHDRVVRVTEQGLLAMGLAKAGQGNLLWFNGDYPLYRFAELQPDYDYYLQLEYDVIVNRPIAATVAEMAARKVDYVGLTKGEAARDWFWLETMLPAYERDAVRKQLICLCAFSAGALRHLWQARLRQSAAYQAAPAATWPFCEGFIPTELAEAGFVCAELSAFGTVSAYDHWPPYLERDGVAMTEQDFIHPVLDEARYVASMHKYHIGLGGYLNPNSQFHRKLRRLPALHYAGALAASFAGKARRNIVRAAAPFTSRSIQKAHN